MRTPRPEPGAAAAERRSRAPRSARPGPHRGGAVGALPVLALAVLALAVLAPAGAAPAAPPGGLPPGDAALVYQVRGTRSDGAAGGSTAWQDLGLRLAQELPGYGRLRVEAHGLHAGDGGAERGWTSAGLAALGRPGAAVDLALGDAVLDASLLPRRLLFLVSPAFALEGGRLDLVSGGLAATAFGGTAVARAGAFGTGVERLGQRVAGLALRRAVGGRAALGAMYLHTEGSSLARSDGAAARADSVGVGADVRLRGPLALVAEARYTASDAGGGSGTGEAVSYLVGPLYDRAGLRLEAAAFSLDPGYVPVERAVVSADRRGLYAAFGWDAAGRAGLFGSGIRSRNNLAGLPAVTTLETTRLVLGGRAVLPTGRPTLLLARAESTRVESVGGAGGPVDATIVSLLGEVSQAIGAFRPVARVRASRREDRAAAAAATTLDLTGELWWRVTRRGRLWTSVQWAETPAVGGTAAGSRYVARLGGENRVRAALFARGEVEVARHDEPGAGYTRAGASATFAYRHRRFDLLLDLRRSRTDPFDAIPARTDDAASLRVVVPLRWGRPLPPPAGRVERGAAGAEGFGSVAGEVFVDLDGDGRRGAGEPGLPGLAVVLDGLPAATAETDAEGHYRFDRVAAGRHSVQLRLRRLPAAYDLVSAQRVEVEVARGREGRADFVVQPLGRIAGRVVRVVTAADGTVVAVGSPLAVPLLLRRGGESWQTFADDGGAFEFPNVRAGEYEVAVDREALLPGAAVTPERHAASLGVGGEVTGLEFVVSEPARPEIRSGPGAPRPAPPPGDAAYPAPAGAP